MGVVDGAVGGADTPQRRQIAAYPMRNSRETEGAMALVECFDRDTNTCPLARACGLQGALNEAFGAFLTVLDRYSLADLIAQPRWMARVAALRPRPREHHA